MNYRCATCGEVHEDLPDVGFTWPDHYYDVPEDERDARTIGTSDICRIDNDQCFIRGIILIPIVEDTRNFGIGAWISQKPENFEIYLHNYNSSEIGPFFGWLCNRIPFYDDDTQLMKTMAHFQGNNQRPIIELEPCDHQLFQDWSKGITMDKAFEYSHSIGC